MPLITYIKNILKSLIPPSERSTSYYDFTFGISAHMREHYTRSPYYFIWTVLSYRLSMAKIRTVLDIGCGAGQMATLLRDKGIPHYIGIDFSPARIAYARKICPEYKFIEVDVFETSIFNTELYDAVLATEFLEHIEHDIELVARFRPGVIFLGTVPNFPSPAHVRHFKSKEEVILRYNPHFTSLKVEPFLENPEGRILYLIEGIKA